MLKYLITTMDCRIGLGIITCNRPQYLQKLLNSISQDSNLDELIIINDGREITEIDISYVAHINNKTNLGVGKSKNKALKYLIEKDCDYIFLIEDDMLILDQTVFKQYITASKKSGIQHFNFGPGSPFNRKQSIRNFDLHNRHLLDEESEPNPRVIIDYKDCQISLYQHCTGTFSFFTKEVLKKVGYIDENYTNAWEHVDHTYNIIKAGYHPPFWWFADLANSHKLITSQEDAINNSTTSKNTESWLKNVQLNAEKYRIKHGHYPAQAVDTQQNDVIMFLKKIKSNG
jgi:GT2 family glycosyltransferase